MSDICVRACKTFIQAFLGVLIPELCIFLQSDFPVDVSAAAMIFAPLLCSALAAGISALWNFLQQHYFKVHAEAYVCVDGISVDADDFED